MTTRPATDDAPPMPDPIHLIYVDDYHLGDPLYLSGMARMMARLKTLPRCLFVHGSGEQAERLLEAEGLFPERKDGLLRVETAQEVALVERALRDVNRRIVGMLTDEGVHAVGVHGLDRRLLRLDDAGGIATGRAGWLADLVRVRVTPVISALIEDPATGNPREAPLVDAVPALARLFDAANTADIGTAVVVVFFTRNNAPGLVEGDQPRPTCSLAALPAGVLPAPEGVRTVVDAGLPVLLTSAAGLFGGEEPQGTRILSSRTA